MASVLSTAGRTIYDLAFRISPILLTGGIATNIGGTLPIVALTEGLSVVNDLLNGDVSFTSTDSAFAHFINDPGAVICRNEYGRYPFANQTVAANAAITEPLTLSIRMLTAQRGAGFYTTRLATMLTLQNALNQHVAQGGLFTVLTPGMIYFNCLFGSLTDQSGDPAAPATDWQWTFEKPLITLNDANTAQNSLMSKLSGGNYTTGSFSLASGGSSMGDLVGAF